MRRLTRSRLARLLFLLTERDLGHVDGMCPCRRPIPRLITEAIRTAIDDVEEAVQQEPDLLGEYIDIKD